MTWRKPGNRDLAEAIVEAFREPPERSRERLSHFSAQAWKKTDYWLEASGLALYFLDHVESLGIDDVIDAATLERLRRDLADNTVRRAAMLAECVAINQAFRDAGVRYANVKGFTLCPDSCPKPALRHQIDFDFLVAGEDLPLARACLEARGYELAAATGKAWEFKADNYSSRSSEHNYKAGAYRAAELHFLPHSEGMPVPDVRMERLGEWRAEGESFPALSSADQLIGQALHLFGHLRGESTRASWVLEFKRHIEAHRTDKAFWESVRQLAVEERNAPLAMGASILLATEMFGGFAPPELEVWALAAVPPAIRLWIEHYGKQAVLADFPGTKLYLLLQQELDRCQGVRHTASQRRLLPRRSAPWVLKKQPRESLPAKVHRCSVQARFLWFRMRFHLVEAARYKRELWRWERLRAQRESVWYDQTGPQSPTHPVASP